MAKILTNAVIPKEKGNFLAGAGVFAIITALGSTMGALGGAVGSALGGYMGSKVAKGEKEKFLIAGIGGLNAVDFVISGLFQEKVLI